MKAISTNLLFYFISLILLVSSCTTDNEPLVDNSLKPRKIIDQMHKDNTIDTIIMAYNGNLLVSKIYQSGYMEEFIYKNGLLSEVKQRHNSNQQLTSHYLVENNNFGEMTKVTSMNEVNGTTKPVSVFEYFYDSGKVSRWVFTNLVNQENSYMRFFKYDNRGNMIEISDFQVDAYGTKKTLGAYYSYDTCKNPWLNVAPYNIPMPQQNKNNITSEKIYSYQHILTAENTYQLVDSQLLFNEHHFEIEYNSEGFPVSISDVDYRSLKIEY